MAKNVKQNTKRITISKIEGGEDEMKQSATASLQLPTKAGEFDETFGQGRRLVFTTYNGNVLIHIREYITTPDRDYPTKVGACFTASRLKALTRILEEIDEQLRQR